jgi:FKBP-type peptidyl-prolyl cis-trans isomerase 2
MSIDAGDTVVLEYTGRLADGTVFDTSRRSVAEAEGLAERQPGRDYEPITVEVGSGQVIEGLDEALVGMGPGEEKTVTVPPGAGYGERSDDRVAEYDAGDFAEMLGGEEVVEGMQVRTEEGHPGEVVHAGDESVRVDFNHELAGETLEFDVEVVDVE